MQLTAAHFDFHKLALSHGWVYLAPFVWDEARQAIGRPLRLDSGENVAVRLSAAPLDNGRLRLFIRHCAVLTTGDKQRVRRQVRRMLSLDQDLTAFHEICETDSLLGFVSQTRAGRMLRSPTLFEDVIKTVCTTNCAWPNTRRMCERLCEIGGGNFPRPRDVLRYGEKRLVRKVPLGYRIRTVMTVARLVEQGRLPLDELAEAGKFDEASEILKNIWGIGPYARAHILMLLGDYSRIPVDCEVLNYLRTVHFAGRKVSQAEAVAPYERFGRFSFLAFKFGRMARKLNYLGSLPTLRHGRETPRAK
jgi:3-methyladenine DNA glycosylase/8-oxoguanine DNA glycosylase